jgi:hypothetical protein
MALRKIKDLGGFVDDNDAQSDDGVDGPEKDAG